VRNLVLIFSIFIFLVPCAYGADTGAQNPTGEGTDASVSPYDDDAWQNNTHNIESDDGTYIYASIAYNDYSYIIYGNNFSFSDYIDDTDTIDGITATINAWCLAGKIDVAYAKLRVGSNYVGDNQYDTPVSISTNTAGTYTAGAADSTWGATVTAADVRASTFGVAYAFECDVGPSDNIYLDYLEVTVYYTEVTGKKSTCSGTFSLE